MNTLLNDSQIDASQLENSQLEISAEQELKVLKNLLNELGDPFHIGVELGKRYQLTMYGIIGYALLSSATMREAISLATRYLSLTYAYCDVSMEQANDKVSLKFTTQVHGDLGTLVLVRDLWASAVLQKELFASQTLPYTLNLEYSPQPDSHRFNQQDLETNLGGKIQFNSDFNGFYGPSAILDMPLAKANELTAQLCEEQCKALLLKKQEWTKLSEQVRDILIKSGLDTPMEAVANQLSRTTRTLHRQLSEEGTSWRKLRDDVRIGLAEELLKQPLQLDEIAERLGYSDASNFSHSFKRCKGFSPTAYRKQKH